MMEAAATTDYHGFRLHRFLVGTNEALIVEPRNAQPGRRWVWRTEFFDAFPAFDLAMLERGWWLGFISVGNTFGCPAAMARFDAFYAEMTGRRGFHRKPVLEGLSRGGLYAYNWAVANPGRVGMVCGDNPVCDFRSWPGGKGTGPGSPGDWAQLLACYQFVSEAEALAWPGNPVDNLAPLVNAGVPLAHTFGDADDIVPWEENTGLMAQRVAALGGTMSLFRKPGCAHHPHGPADPSAFAAWVVEHALP
jgi:pimeloyl-ACP methyl ester carboxylesterase